MTSVVQVVQAASREISNSRDLCSVMLKVVEEVGELGTEVNIATGKSYKQPGPDGVVGECVDAIAALVDLIYIYDPSITEQQLIQLTHAKMHKWATKERQRAVES